MRWRKASRVEHHPQTGVEPIFAGMNVPQCCSYGVESVKGAPKDSHIEPTETALEHPSVWTIVGSRDFNLLQVTVQIYKGKYVIASGMFICAQQEDLMKELQRELSSHMTRAFLQGKRGPAELPSRTQRHSQGPDWEDQTLEVKQQDGWSHLDRRRTCSRGRSGLRQCPSPSPSHPSWNWSPSLSPPWCNTADKQLHCSVENLKLQPISGIQGQGIAMWCLLQKEEKPRKQVWFKIDEELGDELDLPSDLAHFVAMGAAQK